MTRIEAGTSGAFLINGAPHQRGSLQPIRSGDLVGLVSVGKNHVPAGCELKAFGQYVDGPGVPFASAQSFLDYLQPIIFF